MIGVDPGTSPLSGARSTDDLTALFYLLARCYFSINLFKSILAIENIPHNRCFIYIDVVDFLISTEAH